MILKTPERVVVYIDGSVECRTLDLDRYVLERPNETGLFGYERRSLWNEQSLAKLFLLGGFGRVWVGHVPEYGDYMLYVKAVRLES